MNQQTPDTLPSLREEYGLSTLVAFACHLLICAYFVLQLALWCFSDSTLGLAGILPFILGLLVIALAIAPLAAILAWVIGLTVSLTVYIVQHLKAPRA